MNALDYIVKKCQLDIGKHMPMPIEIFDVGRDNLAQWFTELDFKRGAEIGVEQGLYSEVLCRANPQATIYSVDPWKAYPDYRHYFSQPEIDEFYMATQARLSPYKNSRIVRMTSREAFSSGVTGELDFVYVDANHEFSYVVEDIVGWGKLVRSGGIVSGHDYYSPRSPHQCHVIQVTHAYTSAYGIRPWFVLGIKHRMSGDGKVRDKSRSWLWVKP